MSPQVIAAIIAASVSFLTLIGTLAAQYFGRRATSRDTQKALEAQGKQLDRTLAEQRTRTLNERFATAAGQLGSDKPPAVRLAGVYAMAGLADDWPENRQTCVDVLCGYLRMPYEPYPDDDAAADKQLDFHGSREVRHTVIRAITAHLKADAAVSWKGLNFDFTGAIFDGGDFTGAQFTGSEVSFTGVKFSRGEVSFVGAEFSGGTVSFHNAKFTGGEVSFGGARFSGSTVDFTGAGFSGSTVSFTGAGFSGGEVSFDSVGFSSYEVSFSGGTVGFTGGKFTGSKVSFHNAKFTGGTVTFFGVQFTGSEVSFTGAEFTGGTVDFDAGFSGGTVDFTGAGFTGSEIRFSSARFTGAEVDFTNARDWSVPPAFPWTDTPPPGVKLPKKEDQSQA